MVRLMRVKACLKVHNTCLHPLQAGAQVRCPARKPYSTSSYVLLVLRRVPAVSALLIHSQAHAQATPIMLHTFNQHSVFQPLHFILLRGQTAHTTVKHLSHANFSMVGDSNSVYAPTDWVGISKPLGRHPFCQPPFSLANKK